MTINQKCKLKRHLTMKHDTKDFLTKKIHIKVEQINKIFKESKIVRKNMSVHKLFTHIVNQDPPENRQTIYGSVPNCLLYTYNQKFFDLPNV